MRSGIELRSPTWNQYVYDYTNSLISGNSINGTYQNEITIPQYSEEGIWTVRYIYLNDKAGNTIQYATQDLIDLGYETEIYITSNQDTIPPVLTNFSFSPDIVDVSLSEQVVTFDFSCTDNISGYDASGIELRSPTWNQYVYDYTNSLISGNSINGTYQNEITIPQYSEEGTWDC